MATKLLKPFRDYSEHDVLNLFSYAGDVPIDGISAGTVVYIVSDYKQSDGNISNFSDLSSVDNTVSSLFSTVGKVSAVTNYDDLPAPIGITLKDIKEIDENGTPLIYEPRMCAERNIVLPHQAVPVLTKGVVLIGDIDKTDRVNGGLTVDPVGGDPVYVGDNGRVATDGEIVIGKFLSSPDVDGFALILLNVI